MPSRYEEYESSDGLYHIYDYGYDGHDLPEGVIFTEGEGRYVPTDGCALCKRERLTTWYYDIGEWWIADCVTCQVPMVVYIHHIVIPPPVQLSYILRFLRAQSDNLSHTNYPPEKYDFFRRSIPDHFHFHLR